MCLEMAQVIQTKSTNVWPSDDARSFTLRKAQAFEHVTIHYSIWLYNYFTELLLGFPNMIILTF